MGETAHDSEAFSALSWSLAASSLPRLRRRKGLQLHSDGPTVCLTTVEVAQLVALVAVHMLQWQVHLACNWLLLVVLLDG